MINLQELSKLGFGLMRLPEKDGMVDFERVNGMVDSYLAAGLNYFDTAYVYHGGVSEVAVKECLVKRHPRESFMVATKLPAWELHCMDDREKVFNTQLERTGAGYFDFYLLHSLEDGGNYPTYEKYDCFNWCMEKKRQGLIKHFGFSFHGTPELLEKVLDMHPEVEFVQIQLNYLDWDDPVIQSGRLYNILHERNIPMIIMEPVKGGTLANLTPDKAAVFEECTPGRSAASWALRFVASLPGVMTILSGMSNEEQVADNLKTFGSFEPLSQQEQAAVTRVRGIMRGTPLIGCTACRYCTDGCPMGIDIPEIFKAVNAMRLDPKAWRPRNHYRFATEGHGRAGDCVACGQCESVCPQHLDIIELLKEAVEIFEK